MACSFSGPSRTSWQSAARRQCRKFGMNPEELNNLLAQIERLFNAGEWNAAELAVSRLIIIAPHEPRTWAFRGAINFHAGRIPEAELCFCTAIAANPRDATSWHHLSMALHAQSRLE